MKQINDFSLKYFTIQQSHSAMKVGTDGLVLASYVAKHFVSKTEDKLDVLDIGTGTGLIALMLAQKLKNASIQAIDCSKEALLDARANIQNSPYTKQISVLEGDFLTYSFANCFDLIVSNPPFFDSSSLVAKEKARRLARHEAKDGLNIYSLMAQASKLLKDQSSLFVFICPHDREDHLRSYATELMLCPVHLCTIYSKKDKAFRLISMWQKLPLTEPIEINCIEESLLLHDLDGSRTIEFQELYKPFF